MSEKKKATLNRGQFYQLTEELKATADAIKHMRPTWATLSAHVSKKLGFTVVASTLQDACALIGLEWEPADARSHVQKDVWQRLKAAEAEVAVVRGLVHTLYRRLGEKPPAGYVIPDGEAENLSLFGQAQTA